MLFENWFFASGTLFKILFTIFSIIIALADIKTGAIPRIAFCVAFPFFFILRLLQAGPQLPELILGGALTGLTVFLLAFFISSKKLGLADVWYSALIGLALGPWRWYGAISCACIAGIIYMLAFKRRQIPFIPLMALGSVLMIIFV